MKPVYSVCIPLPIYIYIMIYIYIYIYIYIQLLLWYIIHVQDAQIKKCICRRFCVKEKNQKQMYVKKLDPGEQSEKIPANCSDQNVYKILPISDLATHVCTAKPVPASHRNMATVMPCVRPINPLMVQHF